MSEGRWGKVWGRFGRCGLKTEESKKAWIWRKGRGRTRGRYGRGEMKEDLKKCTKEKAERK